MLQVPLTAGCPSLCHLLQPLSSAALLPPALPSPASPGRVTSGEGRAGGWLRTRLLLPPPAPPGLLPVPARGAAAPPHQGPGVPPAQRRPHQDAKHPRGLLGVCCFMSPPRALPDGTAACRRLGNRGSGQSILAAWGRRSRPAAGGRGLKSHLTTTRPLPLCPPRPQLLSESQANMARLVSSVSDVLDTLQKERGGARPRLKADLQRAPARGARPRGCSNGEKGSSSCPGRGCCHGAALCTSLGGRNAPGMGKPAWRALGAVGGLGRREMCPGWVFTVQLQLSSLGSQP